MGDPVAGTLVRVGWMARVGVGVVRRVAVDVERKGVSVDGGGVSVSVGMG